MELLDNWQRSIGHKNASGRWDTTNQYGTGGHLVGDMSYHQDTKLAGGNATLYIKDLCCKVDIAASSLNRTRKVLLG